MDFERLKLHKAENTFSKSETIGPAFIFGHSALF